MKQSTVNWVKTYRTASLMLAIVLSCVMLCPAEAEESAENDWYFETADALCGKLYEVISFDGLAEFYTPQEEIIALIDSWKTAMEAEPKSVNGYPLPALELVSEFAPDMENVPEALIQLVRFITELFCRIRIKTGQHHAGLFDLV